MSSKIKKSKYYTDINDYKNDVNFYEELTVLMAQEKIAELMEIQQISKVKLAKLLNQSKAHVTKLLSEDHNLTLKTFGRVCFHLNASIKDFEMSSIRENVNKNIYKQIQNNFDVSNNYKTEIVESKSINESLKGIINSNTMSSRQRQDIWEFENKDKFICAYNNVA